MKTATAIILLLITYSALAEQSLQRLFYSPSERAAIDANRNNAAPTENKPVSVQRKTERIEVKGYLLREGQPDVVWVNDKNSLKSRKLLADVRVNKVQKNGKVSLRVNGKGTVKLKPGQVLSSTEDTPLERYELQK